MKRALLILMAIICSCSRQGNVGGPERVFERLRSSKNDAERLSCYSVGTIDLLRQGVRRGLFTENQSMYLLPDFSPGVEWNVLEKKISGEKASVVIQFTGHHVENMIGCKKEFSIFSENDGWKIDLTEDIENYLAMRSRSDPSGYIKKLREK